MVAVLAHTSNRLDQESPALGGPRARHREVRAAVCSGIDYKCNPVRVIWPELGTEWMACESLSRRRQSIARAPRLGPALHQTEEFNITLAGYRLQADQPDAQVPLPLPRGCTASEHDPRSTDLLIEWQSRFSRRSFSSTPPGHGWSRVDQPPVPRAPARALLRLRSAEDCFGLLVRDNEAALPRMELEQGCSGLW